MRDKQGKPLRTVWILGAGFSQSLGGPMLADLFRQQSLDDLRRQYPSERYPDLSDDCWRSQVLYNWGGRESQRNWGNAESFIDFVDCAKEGSPEEQMLLRLCGEAKPVDHDGKPLSVDSPPPRFDSLRRVKTAAVRTLAAECSWFARRPEDRPERWDPYKTWLESLIPGSDTIISFNYDQVIESLRTNSFLKTVLPHEAESDFSRSVPLLKLHGSVLWIREDDECREASLSEVLGGPRGWLAIGTPGQSKREHVSRLFDPLWRAAESAIMNAEVVVFLGYRFPETDGDSRHRLLQALEANVSHRLRCQVVLGPDTRLAAAVRVQHMIHVSCRRARQVFLDTFGTHWSRPTLELFVEPLFAQDFIALFSNDGPLSRWGD